MEAACARGRCDGWVMVVAIPEVDHSSYQPGDGQVSALDVAQMAEVVG